MASYNSHSSANEFCTINSSSNNNSSSSSSVRIVIVGAGLSGLTCARRLTQLLKTNSYEITILEARDRIGGRTFSIPELNLDLGASWIFPPHTAVRSLARELGIEAIQQYESGDSLMGGGSSGVRRAAMGSIHGGVIRLRGGTGSLSAGLFKELTSRKDSKINIKLNSPVVAIQHQDDGTIAIRLRDNNQIVTDYVILALPPKLVISSIQFTPALPSSLIRELSGCITWMGSTTKAVLVYDRAWWQEQRLSGFAVSRQGKVQEWHDASSDTCNALFVFCLPGATKQQVIDATVGIFGDAAKNPTAVHITDWSAEMYTSSSVNDGAGGHPHMSNKCRQPQWNGRIWFGNSEVSEEDAGFLEGAVQRGLQVADQLSNILNSQQHKN